MFANRVVACSAAARADGVGREQRRRQAQSRCPGLVVVEHDPARDARAFEPVVVAVEAFCPGVEIVRPGVCAFATRGPSRYFGGDHALAARVVSVVGRSCRVGVADGGFAAEQAARRDLVVPPGESAAFLAPLPVRVLEQPDLTDLLRRLGVATLGDLAALPVAAVVGRFGPDGLRAHRLASGLDERPVAGRLPPPDLQASTELDPPAERVDVAAFAAKAMADALHAGLAGRGLACSRVRIEAETEHGEHLARLWRHDGTLTAAMLAERVRWQLDGWLATPGAVTAGITLLRLVPDEVHVDDGRQLGFWGGDRAATERAGRALVRLQGMLGPDAVVTAAVGGGRGPADRVRLVPWGDARSVPGQRAIERDRDRASGVARARPVTCAGHRPSRATVRRGGRHDRHRRRRHRPGEPERGPRAPVDRRWAVGRHHRLGRAVAGRRALVDGRAPAPGPLAGDHRRRPRPPARPRGRSLAGRGDLRLIAQFVIQ